MCIPDENSVTNVKGRPGRGGVVLASSVMSEDTPSLQQTSSSSTSSSDGDGGGGSGNNSNRSSSPMKISQYIPALIILMAAMAAVT